MISTNPQIDQYLLEGCGRCSLYQTPDCKVHTWQYELKLLRNLVLDCGLTEEYKWSQPCYTHNGANVLIVAAFKDYAIISFFKGSLLQDKGKLLDSPGENSQAARQFRFTDTERIKALEDDIKAYIYEAIEIEKAGLKVDFKAKKELEYPEELESKFEEHPDLKAAFDALTPGRQRGYILHFAQPKQSTTRTSRIEKCMPKIFEGKGFHDR